MAAEEEKSYCLSQSVGFPKADQQKPREVRATVCTFLFLFIRLLGTSKSVTPRVHFEKIEGRFAACNS